MVESGKNFYDILGLTPRATSKDVAEAYRTLVRNHHPDRFADPAEKAGAEELLKRVTEAYNTLSRAAPRAQYDRENLAAASAEAVKKTPQEQAREFSQQAMGRLQSDPAGALSLFDYVLRLTPDDATALFYAGMLRLRSPKWRVQGVQQVEAAIAKDPFNAKFVVDYAKFLLASGQGIRAERILSDALPNHGNDPDVMALLARCQGGGGLPQGGFSLFGKKK